MDELAAALHRWYSSSPARTRVSVTRSSGLMEASTADGDTSSTRRYRGEHELSCTSTFHDRRCSACQLSENDTARYYGVARVHDPAPRPCILRNAGGATRPAPLEALPSLHGGQAKGHLVDRPLFRQYNAFAPVREVGVLAWKAIQAAPDKHLRATTTPPSRDLPEPLALSHWEDVVALCREFTPVTIYAKGVNRWSPELVAAACDAYGMSLLDASITVSARLDIFAGHYPRTPGGIHREPCGNRHMVLVGAKEFYFWDSDVFHRSTRAADIVSYDTKRGREEYVPADLGDDAKAQVVFARPGCIVSWPAWEWHVASAPSPCLSMNIATYGESKPGQASIASVCDDHGRLSVETLTTVLKGGTHDWALRRTLGRLSSGGLEAPPLLLDTPMHRLDHPLSITMPILWCKHDSRVIVAAGGQSRSFTSDVADDVRRLARTQTLTPDMHPDLGAFVSALLTTASGGRGEEG